MSSTTKRAAKAPTPVAATPKASAKRGSTKTSTGRSKKAAPNTAKPKGAGHAVVVLIAHGSYGEVINGTPSIFTRDQPVLVSQAVAKRLALVASCDLPGHNHDEPNFSPAFITFGSVAAYEAAAAKAADVVDERRRKAARAEAEAIIAAAMAPRAKPTLRKHVSLRGDPWSGPEPTALRLQAEASSLLDELASWAERTADPAEDAETLATDGLRILDGAAQRIRERLGSDAKSQQASSDRGPAPHDGLDMGKALAARRKGLPTKTVFDHVVEDPRPKPPAGFWPTDLSASVAAKKKARER